MPSAVNCRASPSRCRTSSAGVQRVRADGARRPSMPTSRPSWSDICEGLRRASPTWASNPICISCSPTAERWARKRPSTVPVHTILSGPAAGVIGAVAIAQQAGKPNSISIDMGGTSFDVSLSYKGEVRRTQESELERLPVKVPMVDIHTLGAGGGSIAWIGPRRSAPSWATERGSRSRPCVLRQRRRGSHGNGRKPRSRQARCYQPARRNDDA